MKYYVFVGLLWANVFVIAWLQMLRLIDLWPSTLYLIMFGVVGVAGVMILFGNEIKPPTGTV